jgi:hypothetical protein
MQVSPQRLHKEISATEGARNGRIHILRTTPVFAGAARKPVDLPSRM